MKEEKIDGYEKYELESAVRTLKEAEVIKADAKMMKALQPFLKKEIEAIKSIADLTAKREKLEAEGL